MDALKGLAWLLLAQSAGEALVRLAAVPLPGPVMGLLILLVALRWEPVRRPVGAAAEVLLAHLSLLFVPVGVGVMTHLGLIAEYGARMLLVVVLSTWTGMAVGALVLRALLRSKG
ncbi:CidA/LrgA family protein [uncultured Piscinibacter sp.]|uniref:CidA/LrgA family protein n=1 Tax=uncultured Piscinibacter sp. TaxID=1131835 RepID=UPI002625E611|nr:CidA/LrgA family protein [uncultured Piscinibacter sp.]